MTRNISACTREALLDMVWQTAEEHLRDLPEQPAYADVLQQLAVSAAHILESGAIRLSADPVGHRYLTPERLEAWTQEIAQDFPVTFVCAAQPATTWGGLVASEEDGRRQIDATFPTRLALAEEEITRTCSRPAGGRMNSIAGAVTRVNGPVVHAHVTGQLAMLEQVWIGDAHLSGEVIALNHDEATIQVYEETTGLRPGEPLFGSGHPLSVALGPGLLGGIFDGIQRPLEAIRQATGIYVGRGIQVSPLPNKRWSFHASSAGGRSSRARRCVGRCARDGAD